MYLVFVAVAIAVEVAEFVTLCKAKKNSDRKCAYFTVLWNYVDLAAITTQIVAVFLWLEVQSSLTVDAFNPRLSYDVYDVSPDCPLANLARFNNSEVTELRLLYAAADHLAVKRSMYQVDSERQMRERQTERQRERDRQCASVKGPG